jgi:hypothetical protein
VSSGQARLVRVGKALQVFRGMFGGHHAGGSPGGRSESEMSTSRRCWRVVVMLPEGSCTAFEPESVARDPCISRGRPMCASRTVPGLAGPEESRG